MIGIIILFYPLGFPLCPDPSLSTLIDIPQVLVIVVAVAYIRGQGFGGYNSGGFGDGGSTFDTGSGGKRSPLQPEGKNLL